METEPSKSGLAAGWLAHWSRTSADGRLWSPLWRGDAFPRTSCGRVRASQFDAIGIQSESALSLIRAIVRSKRFRRRSGGTRLAPSRLYGPVRMFDRGNLVLTDCLTGSADCLTASGGFVTATRIASGKIGLMTGFGTGAVSRYC
jgi:hypothetical protein